MTLPRTPSFRLDGKRALVTGATSGIGLACAAALGEAGARLVVAARRTDKLASLVHSLQSVGHNAEALSLFRKEKEETAHETSESEEVSENDADEHDGLLPRTYGAKNFSNKPQNSTMA